MGVCQSGAKACSSGALTTTRPERTPATEACNGADDDCDDTIDEDFECPANGTVSGVNMCGHTGARRCASNCTWLDADYYLAAETSITCDYCDDTGRGLSEESGPAADVTNLMVGDDATEITLLGDAVDFGSLVVLATYWDRTSAAYLEPLEFGNGAMTISANIVAAPRSSSIPGLGWALLLLEEGGSGSLLGSGGNRLAVPTGYDGYVVEWRFDNDVGPGGERDTVALARLDASSTALLSIGPEHNISSPPGLDGDTDPNVMQQLRLFIRPDDPTTISDETRIEMDVLNTGVLIYRTTCDGVSCGLTVVRGRQYYVGVSATTDSTRNADIGVSQLTIIREDVCP